MFLDATSTRTTHRASGEAADGLGPVHVPAPPAVLDRAALLAGLDPTRGSLHGGACFEDTTTSMWGW